MKLFKHVLWAALQLLLIMGGIMIVFLPYNPGYLTKFKWIIHFAGVALCYFVYLDYKAREEKTALVKALLGIRLEINDAISRRALARAKRELQSKGETDSNFIEHYAEERALEDTNEIFYILERWEDELVLEDIESRPSAAKAKKAPAPAAKPAALANGGSTRYTAQQDPRPALRPMGANDKFQMRPLGEDDAIVDEEHEVSDDELDALFRDASKTLRKAVPRG